MPLVKKLGVIVWKNLVEDFGRLLKVAIKSLFYGPLFYGVNWLISHRAPSHDMWFGFFFAAVVFTVANKKANRHPNKEETQRPPTPIIILPSSR